VELKLELINMDAVRYQALASECWRNYQERNAAAANGTHTPLDSETCLKSKHIFTARGRK